MRDTSTGPPQGCVRILPSVRERNRGPIVQRGGGIDGRSVGRVAPSVALHHLVRISLGQPRQGVLRTTR